MMSIAQKRCAYVSALATASVMFACAAFAATNVWVPGSAFRFWSAQSKKGMEEYTPCVAKGMKDGAAVLRPPTVCAACVVEVPEKIAEGGWELWYRTEARGLLRVVYQVGSHFTTNNVELPATSGKRYGVKRICEMQRVPSGFHAFHLLWRSPHELVIDGICLASGSSDRTQEGSATGLPDGKKRMPLLPSRRQRPLNPSGGT